VTLTMRSPNSFILEAVARARHQAAYSRADSESRYPDRRINRMGGNVAHALLPLAYLMAISLASWGVAHLLDRAPHSSVGACVTSGIRPLVSDDIRGTGEFCVAAAAARASVYIDQLRPGGTYTTLLVYPRMHLQRARPCVCRIQVRVRSRRGQCGWWIHQMLTNRGDCRPAKRCPRYVCRTGQRCSLC
jgi:hypothetical protein